MEARRGGHLDKLSFFLDRKEMEEVQVRLQAIQALARKDSLVSVRLLDPEGRVIDQVGTLVSLQTASTNLPGKNDAFMLSVMVASKPSQPRSYKVIWAGIDGAGKSTLLHRIKHGEFLDSRPSLGMSIQDLDFEGHEIENIDIAGNDGLRLVIIQALTREVKIDAVAFVIDAAEPARLPESIDFMKDILKVPQLAEIPIAIIVAKSDVPGALSRQDIIDGVELGTLISGRRCTVIEVSSKTGQGIIDVLHFLARILHASR
ncbi:MAG: ADP-ribosylation factor-like protein [Candidatus Sigynarchaeota archaeon]